MLPRPLKIAGALAVIVGAILWLLWPTTDRAIDRVDGSRPAAATRRGADLGPKTRPPVPGQARLAGRIVDLEDAPIPGARACAAIPALDTEMGYRPRCVDADEDGRFEFDPIAPGRHRLTATARGFIPLPVASGEPGLRAVVGPGEAVDDLVLRLRPGGAEVRGILRDITGGTVSDAQVWSDSAITWSDDEGRFSLWLDVRSYVRLEVEAEGYARAGVGEHQPIGRVIEVLLRPEVILRGRVIAAGSGAPIVDAPVIARAPYLLSYAGSFASEPQVRTGPDGRFRFKGLAPGRYKPEVRAASWRGQANESALLVIGGPPAEVVIEVHPARRIEGRITRDGGEACEGCGITIYDAAGAVVDRDLAEADGSVAVGGLLPGRYAVEVLSAQGAASPPTSIDLSEGDALDERWEVDASGGRAIRGRVVDASGRGVALAYVQGELMEPEEPGAHAVAQAITAADGTFECTHLPAGVYSFYRVDAEGMAPPVEDPKVTLSSARDLDDLVITLPRPGALIVKVQDPRGEPVLSAQLTVSRVGGHGSHLQPREGAVWTLDPTTPGTYHAKISRPGVGGRAGPEDPSRDDPGEEIEVVAGRTATLTLVTAPRDRTIRGIVRTGDGDLVADAAVWAESHETYLDWGGSPRHPEVARVHTDLDGAFELEGLEEGTYSIHARDQAGVERSVDGIQSGAVDVAIALPEVGALAGRVEVRGGDPPARFTISIKPADGTRGRSEEFLYSDGEWRIRGLPPGPVNVEVQAAEGTASRKATIPEGGEADGVTLGLAARGALRGRVVDADTGAPVAGYMARVQSANGRASAAELDPGGRRTTDADGRFELQQVPSGPVVLHLWPAGARSGGYVDAEVTLTVRPGGTTDAGVVRARKRGDPRANEANDANDPGDADATAGAATPDTATEGSTGGV
ncbi:MAG: carboxypeptidase regulatory-like domain-containing protein [Nannocystaceae bacterium]